MQILPAPALERELLGRPLMRYFSRSTLALLLAGAFAAACASSPVGPDTLPAGGGSTSITSDQVAGTWMLVSIQPSGQAEQAAPSSMLYSLLLADGRVTAKVECNVCGGSLVVGDQALTIGPLLACTRAACPTMAFGNIYTTILAGDSTARIDGNTLTLTSSRGTLRFRR
jgi:heat shock protein HslJ